MKEKSKQLKSLDHHQPLNRFFQINLHCMTISDSEKICLSEKHWDGHEKFQQNSRLADKVAFILRLLLLVLFFFENHSLRQQINIILSFLMLSYKCMPALLYLFNDEIKIWKLFCYIHTDTSRRSILGLNCLYVFSWDWHQK